MNIEDTVLSISFSGSHLSNSFKELWADNFITKIGGGGEWELVDMIKGFVTFHT